MSDPMIPLFDVQLSDADLAAVEATLRSGWLTMGPRTDEFEELFARHLGVRHAIAVSSCTSALHLAYLAAAVEPGDEVIVPAITFVATAAAARYCGATPVFADVIGAHDLSIDPADVERRITSRTKAVCIVHYAGYAGPVARLRRLCDARGIALIEDAAHSPSATPAVGGRKLGGYGLAGCFSFFSNKVLSCGEGGLLATDDDEVAASVRRLRSHAMTSSTWDRHRGHSRSYDVTGLGYNYRLDDPRAALLISRLPRLEGDIGRRRALVRRYRELLEGVDGVVLPYSDAEVQTSSCHVMPVVLDDAELQGPLRHVMRERWGVETSLLYPSITEFTAYRNGLQAPVLRSERIARTQVTIPLYPHLSRPDQDRVVAALIGGLANVRSSTSALDSPVRTWTPSAPS
jgi:dTDP-4-amino-4,6-dideoxygalactose transaminase